MVKLFRAVLLGANEELAKRLVVSFTGVDEPALTGPTVFNVEDWKILAFPSWPGSPVKLPKVIEAVIVNVGPGENSELKEAAQQFSNVVHKLAVISEEDQIPLAASIGFNVVPEEALSNVFGHILQLDAELTELIQREFTAFDRDSSGFIDLNELREIARQLNQEVSEEELQTALAELDENRDGKISLHEFTVWWKSGRKGKGKTLRKLTRGVAKVKNLIADAHSEILKLLEVEDAEPKYVNLGIEIEKGAFTTPNFGFSYDFYNSTSEVRAHADSKVPEGNSTDVYLQLAFKSSNPEQAAAVLQAVYKTIVDIIVAESPDSVSYTSLIDFLTSFDEEKVYVTIKSVLADLALGDFAEYKTLLFPNYPSNLHFSVLSQGDLSHGIGNALLQDGKISIKARVPQAAQQLFLDLGSSAGVVDQETVLGLGIIGLLQTVDFNIKVNSTDESQTLVPSDVLDALNSVRHRSKPFVEELLSQFGTEVDIQSIIGQVKALVSTDELDIVVATLIATQSLKIYSKNLIDVFLG